MKYPKRVSSGRYIDMGDFTPEYVDFDDINTSLNYLYRFIGHHKDAEPLTVAQHTILTRNIALEFFPDEPFVHLDCVLHDMPEAYYGDIATPVKKLLGDSYRPFADAVDRAVYESLVPGFINRLDYEEIKEKRKICDLISLDIERRMMWKDQRGKNLWPEPKNTLSMKRKEEMFYDVANTRFWDLGIAFDDAMDTLKENKIRLAA